MQSTVAGVMSNFTANRVIASRGGGLFLNSSTARVVITDSLFQSNLAYYVGGGIYTATPNAVLRRVSVAGNSVRGAFPYAGGIAAEVLSEGTLVIDQSRVEGNTVTQTSGAEAASSKAFATDAVNLLGQLKGGGLYVVCPPGVTFRVNITSSRFLMNQADSGSFIAAPGSGTIVLDVRTTLFSQNVAANDGGAHLGDNVTSTWDACTFQSNVAADGAAFYLNGTLSSTTVTNSLFIGNQAGQGACAAVANSHVVSMRGCNMTGNTAFGGAVFHADELAPGLNLTQLVRPSALWLSGNTAAYGWFMSVHKAYADIPLCGDCTVSRGNAATSGPYPIGTVPATYSVTAPGTVKSGGYLLLKCVPPLRMHVRRLPCPDVCAESASRTDLANASVHCSRYQ